ncbi:DNA (cytosine-5-)-methyltransferase [Mobiluncus mulieris]|uniref:DNA (cytosine-5-)-methyltransferase n=1 Tax=Mobiluncus mulieris TaxID=2052 RepID=UPI00242D43EB|nr:DNA (cytosine-5-)-methyltransferase [Mobiluncus mulieris]
MADGEKTPIRVAELFAGVGGFRLGLEGWAGDATAPGTLPSAGNFTTIWANQWEPPGTLPRQFAARCYQSHFGENSVINRDIARVMDDAEAGQIEIPDVDLVVGGFPCQDYSVAKPLSFAGGIEGKKGVLWWEIYRFLKLKTPAMVLLENVDRLLKSPAKQRGRDFAIILSTLAGLGYSVAWRVVNSGEYGFTQRRKRVFVYAEHGRSWDLDAELRSGIFHEAFPAALGVINQFGIPKDPYLASQNFGIGLKTSPFETAGVMQDYRVLTTNVTEEYHGKRLVLGDVLVPETEVPAAFWVSDADLSRWRYLKGYKREERVNKTTGHVYFYSEGAMSCPDPLDRPSRTILTGEGGKSPSRFKHIIEPVPGRFRRLVPDELDLLQGFPQGWTNTGMSDNNRAFCMGNALVVGVVNRLGRVISQRFALQNTRVSELRGRPRSAA